MKNRNDKEDEVWVVLKQGGDTYNRYEVSNYARVWDLNNDTEVSQVITGKPQYLYVNLYKDCSKERALRRVHNILGWSFLGHPPTPKHTVDHIDQDKLNNHLSNLRWASRRKQMSNRSNTVVCEDGELLVDKIINYCKEYNEDFDTTTSSMYSLYKTYNDFGICIKYRQYYLKYGSGWYYEITLKSGNTYKIVELCEMFDLDYKDTKEKILSKGFTFEEVLYGYDFKLCETGYPDSVEYNGCWYANKRQLNKLEGVVSYNAFLERLSGGMSLDEALSYEHGKIHIDGFYMTQQGHCERLYISHGRISGLMNKHKISFEEAIKRPIVRVTKHYINGEVKTNADWYGFFNIPKRVANSMLAKINKHTKVKNTFRDILEYYNIDTSFMKIYPCDGEVVQFNSPL